MRELDKALAEISEIRSQLARDTEFRGYGPATLAATGCLAVLGAAFQAMWLERPMESIGAYLGLWIFTAALSVAVIGVEVVVRARRIHSGFAEEMIQSAIEQFLPAAMTGALLTAVLFRFAPDSLWMLPGLWQVIFSLGVFASCRFLPRAMFAVGFWYLGTGLFCLAFFVGEQSLSPWAMGIPFGVGQLLVAAIVFHSQRGDNEAA